MNDFLCLNTCRRPPFCEAVTLNAVAEHRLALLPPQEGTYSCKGEGSFILAEQPCQRKPRLQRLIVILVSAVVALKRTDWILTSKTVIEKVSFKCHVFSLRRWGTLGLHVLLRAADGKGSKWFGNDRKPSKTENCSVLVIWQGVHTECWASTHLCSDSRNKHKRVKHQQQL